MDINRNNYESVFLLYLDRELNAADRAAVENFLNENADLQKDFRLLQKTIQWPTEIVFEHKESLYREEGKKRFIPIYWIRIAAAFTLILTTSWFLMTLIRSHPKDHSTRQQKLATLDSKKNPAIQQSAGENEAAPDLAKKGNSGGPKLVVKGRNQRVPSDLVKIAKGLRNENRDIPNGKIQPVVSEEIHSATDEKLIVVQKSKVNWELQTDGNRNGSVDPGPLQSPIGVQTPVLLLAVAQNNPVPANEKSGEQDIQSENSISVIALNDRNKAIAGFFKKLTKHAPAGETADNNKKLRVSVFQFGY